MTIVGRSDEVDPKRDQFLMTVFNSNLQDYVNGYGYLNLKNGNYAACYCDDSMGVPFIANFDFIVKDHSIELVKCFVENEEGLQYWIASFYYPKFAFNEYWTDRQIEKIEQKTYDHYNDQKFLQYYITTLELYDDYQLLIW